MGMVGGGPGSFIGGVHRIAAAIDNEIELVCGAFSSSAEKSKAFAKTLYIPENRGYGSYEDMIRKEALLPDNERMDFVAITTPNHLHHQPAVLALQNGFHVICDKPLAFSMEEALDIKKYVDQSGKVFALTHNYSAYPMIKQAKDMIRNGELGALRKVVVEYPQGWLSQNLEESGHKQAEWRTDPTRSGIAGAVGDIGTHAAHLLEYTTGMKITKLCADVHTFVSGRALDDDASILIQMEKGVRGVLYCSQISTGEENPLRIRIYGEKAGIEWMQMEPNTLKVKRTGEPTQLYRTGIGAMSTSAEAHFRIPGGHPEGYLEAFANLYRNFARAVRKHPESDPERDLYDFPTVDDGIRGMHFIQKVIESGNSNQKWISL